MVAAHGARPPPASVSAIWRFCDSPAPTRPNERFEGLAKTSGASARGRSTRPPPSRLTDTSGLSAPADGWTGSPVVASADLNCCGVHVGCRCLRTATAPATCGVAMLVPSQLSQSLPGTEERMFSPGAVTSSLNCSESGDGALSEKPAITSAGPLGPPSLEAATV